MKRLGLILFCCASVAGAAEVSAVRTVYIMQMAHGLDQFLANRLTNEHVYQVVTDPKLADAVLTDHIGTAFEQQLDELRPAPEPVKKPAPAAQKSDESSTVPMLVDPDAKMPDMALTSTFGRNKGTVFLVDPKSKQVLWSVFELPKGMDSKEMDRTASDIVSRLKKDLSPPKK